MATAPTLPFLSVEEYLRTDYEPNTEYLDGILKPKALSDRTHGHFQAIIAAYLLSQEKNHGFISLIELHARVGPTRFRIPDVCILTNVPQDDRYADVNSPPLLTVEIVSKGEPWTDLRDKMADHLAMGVPTVILADPYHKTVMIATQTEPVHELRAPLTVNIEVPGSGTLQIDFDALFAQL